MTIDGRGVRARPFRLIADIGSVPGKLPRSSSTNRPLT